MAYFCSLHQCKINYVNIHVVMLHVTCDLFRSTCNKITLIYMQVAGDRSMPTYFCGIKYVDILAMVTYFWPQHAWWKLKQNILFCFVNKWCQSKETMNKSTAFPWVLWFFVTRYLHFISVDKSVIVPRKCSLKYQLYAVQVDR